MQINADAYSPISLQHPLKILGRTQFEGGNVSSPSSYPFGKPYLLQEVTRFTGYTVERCNDVGEFQFKIPASHVQRENIKRRNLIRIGDFIGIINYFTYEKTPHGYQVTIGGKNLLEYLARRVIGVPNPAIQPSCAWAKRTATNPDPLYEGNVGEESIDGLVDKARKFPELWEYELTKQQNATTVGNMLYQGTDVQCIEKLYVDYMIGANGSSTDASNPPGMLLYNKAAVLGGSAKDVTPSLLDGYSIAASDGDASYRWEFRFDTLLDAIRANCSFRNLCFEMQPLSNNDSPAMAKFRVFEGRKTGLIIKDTDKGISNFTFGEDESNVVNSAFAYGSSVGAYEVTANYAYNDPDAAAAGVVLLTVVQRNSTFDNEYVDANIALQSDDMFSDEYIGDYLRPGVVTSSSSSTNSDAAAALVAPSKTVDFTYTNYGVYKYKEDFELGDFVTFKSDAANMNELYQLREVKTNYEAGKHLNYDLSWGNDPISFDTEMLKGIRKSNSAIRRA